MENIHWWCPSCGVKFNETTVIKQFYNSQIFQIKNVLLTYLYVYNLYFFIGNIFCDLFVCFSQARVSHPVPFYDYVPHIESYKNKVNLIRATLHNIVRSLLIIIILSMVSHLHFFYYVHMPSIKLILLFMLIFILFVVYLLYIQSI